MKLGLIIKLRKVAPGDTKFQLNAQPSNSIKDFGPYKSLYPQLIE